MQINVNEEATSKTSRASAQVEVDVLNFNIAALTNEFLVGVAVAAIVISALVASSLFRTLRWRSPPVPWCCSTCRAARPR
jgi:hypothetical protein